MNGIVDASGRALLELQISRTPKSESQSMQVWIDTGFTGDLVIPQATVDHFGLEQSATVDAVLADGSAVELNTYSCYVDWFAEQRQLEVIANDGSYPLLGVGMLIGLELRVNYHDLTLTLVSPFS